MGRMSKYTEAYRKLLRSLKVTETDEERADILLAFDFKKGTAIGEAREFVDLCIKQSGVLASNKEKGGLKLVVKLTEKAKLASEHYVEVTRKKV